MQAESTGHHAPQNAAGATILPARKILGATFGFLKNNWGRFSFIVMLPVIFLGVILSVSIAIENWSKDLSISVGFISILAAMSLLVIIVAYFACYLITPLVALRFMHNSNSGNNSLIDAYVDSFRIFHSYLWLLIISSMIAIATFALFLIPGIIVLIYTSLAVPILAEHKWKGLNSLAYSTNLVRGNWWKMLWRLIVISISGFVPSLIIMAALIYLFYSLSGVDFKTFTSLEITGSYMDIIQMFSAGIMSLILYPAVYFLYKSVVSSRPEISEEKIKKTRSIFFGISIIGAVLLIVLSIILLITAVKTIGSKIREQNYNINLSGTSLIQYKDPAGYFTISYPNTWDVDEEKDAVFFIAPSRSRQSLSRGSVMVTITPLTVGSTLHDAEISFDKELKNNPQEIANERTVIKKEEATLSGLPAITYFTSKKRSFDGGTTYITQVSEETLVVKNDVAYVVGYKNNIIEYESLRPTGLRVVETFKILK